MENGEWKIQIENGELRIENGEWKIQIENGELRIENYKRSN